MKKLLLFITTMLLWSFSLYSVDVQIGSGTTTTSYFPIYSCYNYSYSQQIYLAGEISDAGGGIGPITKIRFFYSSGGTSYSTWSDWTIYLGNTSKSVFSSTTDWIPLAELTEVFSGNIPTPVAGDWIEITLPTSFNYTGGNLVVAVDENSASYSCTAAWRSYNAGTNRGIMYYDDNTNPNPASPPTAKNGPTVTIAQVQFDMAAAPPCSGTPDPGNTVSSLEYACSGVDFTLSLQNFVPGTGITYQWQSSVTGGEPWTDMGTAATQVASQTVPTYYRCYVTCENSEESAFSTPLLVPMYVASVPYEEGFLTTTAPSCWTTTGWLIGSVRGVTGNPGYNIYKNIYGTGSSGTSFKTCEIGPVSAGMVLTFDYKVANYSSPYAPPAANSGNFVVAVSADGGTSFTDLETVANNGIAGWQTKSYPLNDYDGKNIIIKITGNWEIGDWDMAFDNIKVAVPPACPPPTNLVVSEIAKYSAKISWIPGDVEIIWNLKYGAPGFDPETEGTLVENIQTNSHTISGLNASTQYQVYVQADCNGTVSTWAGPVIFKTLCEAFSLPFAEDFTGLATGNIPDCWFRTSTNWGGVATANAGGTSPEMQFNWSPSFTGVSRLITPEISTGDASEFLISFNQYLNDYSTFEGEYIAVEYSIDNGNYWEEIWHYDCDASLAATLTEIIFEIPAKADEFLIAFKYDGNSYNINYWYIDNIVIEEYVAGNLAGNVSGGRGPIEGARVFGNGFEAFTDENGDYLIEDIIAGTYDITCEAEGFLTKLEEDFEIEGGDNTLDFVLNFAQIAVDPESFEVEILPGGQKTEMLNISNPAGTGPLTWSAIIKYQSGRSTSSVQPFTYGEIVEMNNTDKSKDACETTTTVSGGQTRDTWDILQSFSVSAGGEQGIATDGEYIYTAFWGTNGKFGKYTLAGEFIETFIIANVGGIRDLTYDGTYFYGGGGATTIYKLDFAKKTLEGTITSPVNVRHLSYDPVEDAFWCGDWTSLRLVSRAGTTLVTGTTLVSVYGSAYDGYSVGGPYLWFFSQTAVAGYGTEDDRVMIQQYNIATNSITGVFHCAIDIPGYQAESSAGGAFATDLLIPGKYVLMVNVQNTPNLVGVYELENTGNWLDLSGYNGVIQPTDDQDIQVNFNTAGLEEGTYNATIKITHDGQNVTKGLVEIPVTMHVYPPCPKPVDLTVDNITQTSAVLNWTAIGNETTWNLKYGAPGFDPETEGTLVGGITKPYLLEGLNHSTDYAFRVQAVCDVKELSNWSKEKVFLTLCGANELPFVEDFEGVGFPPKCWNIYDLDGGGTQWVVSSAQNHTPGGSKSAYHQWASGDQDGWLVTPQIQLPEDLDINLSFWSFNLYPGDYGENSVLISTGSGDPEDEEFELLWSPETVTQPWEETLIPLTDYAGEDVYIAFRYTGDYAHSWFVDDVQVFVPGNVEGYVSEATSPKNRTPIEGARVFTAHYEAFTDASGYYKLEGLPAGFYDISCEAEGYFISIEENFEIVEDDTKSLNFTLDYAQIAVNPDEFDVVLPHESIKIEKLTISNPNGTAPLTWNAQISFSNKRDSYQHFNFSSNFSNNYKEDALLSGDSHAAATPTREYTTCPQGSLFSLEPDLDDWAVVTSEEDPGYVAFQYFSDVNGLIGGITFWGGNLIYSSGWSACNDEDPMPFIIEFYTDDNGVPGDFVTSFSASISRIDTQIPVGAYGNFYLYSLEFDEAIALSSGWVAIQGQTSTPDCWFMWAGTYEGVGTPYLQWDGTAFDIGDYALSMCLTEFVGSDLWLSLNNYSGVIQPNDNQDIQVIFNSAGLEEGDYHATIKVNHDGQEVGKGQVQVPVTMGVYPHCRKPKDLTATLVNPTDFELGWTPMGETSVFNVILTDDAAFEIGGAIDPYDSFEGIEDNPLFIEDLQPETDYWFYVQADCGEAELNAPEVDRFWLDINTQGNIVPANSGGTANEPGEDGTWRLYTDMVTGQSYYSIWFYNSHLDMYGMNKMKMGFYVQKSNPIAAANVSFIVSYSTPDWDPDTTGFPMPDDEEFILRSPANGPYILTVTGQNKQWFELEFDIPDYNPEWISVSIIGSNIKIANTTWTKPTSLIGLDEYWDVNATGCGIIVHENLPQPKSAWAGPKKFTTLPLCPTPTNLTVSDITTTSAVFDWVAGFDETTWNLKYYKVGVGDTVFANSITKPYPCTGLTLNTNYAFKVQADCGSDVSAWSVAKAFKTPCDTEDIPYVQNFDGVTAPAIPDCMTVTNDNGDARLWVTSTTYPKTTPNSMYILYNTTLAMNDWFFTPGLNLIGGKTYIVEFYYRGSSATWPEKLEVKWGTAPNAAGMTGGQIWNNANIINTVYALATAAFTPGETGVYYVGWHGYSNADMNYLCVDDILIDLAPTCPAPTALTVSEITTTSTLLEWTAGGTETTWNLKYGEPGFDPETEGTLISGITTNPFLLEGLNSSTAYAFSVQADCGEGDVSAWSVMKTFTTLCGPVDLPYTENFDGVTAPAVPNCMTVTDDNNDDKKWVTNTLYSRSTPNSMYMAYNASLAMDDWFFTPGLILTGGKTYIVEFYYRCYSASYPEKLEVKWGTNPNAAGMTGEQIWNNSNITNTVYTLATGEFTPDEDGVYYVGWHGYSAANMWNLYVDDISITQDEEPGPPENPTYTGVLEDDCYDGLGELTIDNAQVEEGTVTEFRAEVSIVATDFTVEEDAAAYLYAGQNIVLGVGVHVAQGADFLATIMDEITYCEQAAAMVTAKSEEIAPAVITPAEMDAMFTVFPNPTTGRFTLMMKEADESSVINVEIFGLMGERVLQTQLFGQNQYEFDLSGSPKGVYIVRVLNGKQISIEKLIKQ